MVCPGGSTPCPGVPCAVGSGRASVAHKVHAVFHSLRLVTNTLAEAVQALNSTLTFTGDLGTESQFCKFHRDARQFYGPWIAAEDEDAGSDGGQDDEEELDPMGDGFQFQPVGFVGQPAQGEGAAVGNVEA